MFKASHSSVVSLYTPTDHRRSGPHTQHTQPLLKPHSSSVTAFSQALLCNLGPSRRTSCPWMYLRVRLWFWSFLESPFSSRDRVASVPPLRAVVLLWETKRGLCWFCMPLPGPSPCLLSPVILSKTSTGDQPGSFCVPGQLMYAVTPGYESTHIFSFVGVCCCCFVLNSGVWECYWKC